jgi:hypothetical protein
MADKKLTVQQLEELAHELYEAWMDDKVKADEKWKKYLTVKEELDRRKGLT